MTYKISLKILRQNVVGGGNVIPPIYSDGIKFNKKTCIHYFKPLESMLVQSVEVLRNKTYSNNVD